MTAPRETVTRLTDAPEAYDGFGTKTTERLDLYNRRGDQLREVEIEIENLTWQATRYASGLHVCLNRDAPIDRYILSKEFAPRQTNEGEQA